MNQAEKKALVALPISLIIALVLAWAGSQGGHIINGSPIFAGGIALAFIIQWIAFIPAMIQKNERFFDLIGSITFVSVMGIALILIPQPDLRAFLLAGLIAIWAIRLGTFLFRRVHRAGSDSRFDEIKVSFWRFLLAWTLQGLWVSFSVAAALAAITSTLKLDIGWLSILGLVLWMGGFGLEVIADYQKSQFRKKPENKGRFIHVGLWSWSRHPNYFGEIVLWIGIALIALPVLTGWQLLTLISPIFITFLLTRVSGIPMLEEKADAKWGGQKDYEAYKASTSILVPMPPKVSNSF